MADTTRLFDETAPELVVHLAAGVGGIGANRENPGRYWYANMMMGAHVARAGAVDGRPKLVIAGTICAYPKLPPFRSTRTSCGTAIRRRRTRPTASRRRRCSSARRPIASSTASNAIFLLPVNLYGPGDNFDLETSHVIPAMIRKWSRRGTRRAGDRAVGRRHANSRVPLRGRLRRRPSRWPPSVTTARPGERRHRQGDRDRRPGGVGRAPRPGSRGRSTGIRPSRTGSRAAGSTRPRAVELFGFTAAGPVGRRASPGRSPGTAENHEP